MAKPSRSVDILPNLAPLADLRLLTPDYTLTAGNEGTSIRLCQPESLVCCTSYEQVA